MGTHGKFGRFLLYLLLSWTVSGCVYYNTFYNARKQYRQAEQKRLEVDTPGSRVTPQIYRQYYMAAIKKASAVLDLYPTSKWVDDSLLMIGKAYYWRAEYSEALIKFQELQENFPDSELISESLYWQGLTLWAVDQINDARHVLQLLREASAPTLFRRSRLVLAEMEAESGDYEGAIEAYHDLLGTKDDLQAQAWQGIGSSLFRLERYGEALQAYRHVLASGPTTQTNFETRIRMGGVLEMQGKLDEAMEVYGGILKVKRLKIYEPEIRLKQANVYRLKGQLDRAVETYQKITQRNPRTEYSAEAYYRMGLIEQKQRKDLDQAKELFEKATKEKYGSDAAKLAQRRQKDLAALARYRKQIDKQKGKVKSLPALFSMAELYLFNLGEPDSALAVYQHALEVADSTDYAPKALYAIGLIYADSLENADTAREIFQNLIDTYPVTPYAVRARERIQHQRTDDALAEARFLEAEALKQEGAGVEDYLTILRQVAAEYPKSLFAPKALYTLAWTYENDLNSLDTAREHYQKLVDDYPLTAFSEVASQKLKGGFLKPVEALPAASEDTSKAPQNGDGRVAAAPEGAKPPPPPAELPLTFAEVDEKPRLLEAASDEYMQEVLEEAMEVEVEERGGEVLKGTATVVVNVLIGKRGRIRDAKVLSGHAFLHEAALNAADQYRFWPGKHQGKPREVWMEIDIRFTIW